MPKHKQPRFAPSKGRPIRLLTPAQADAAMAVDAASSSLAASHSSRRSDAPAVNAYTRGSKELALMIASDPVRREAAAQEAEQGAYSVSGWLSRTSNLRTWVDLSLAAGFKDPFELTPRQIRTLSGVLKQAGYRSAYTIVCTAKLEALDRDVVWSANMQRALDKSRRYLKRGQGPPKGARAFCFSMAIKIKNGDPWWAEDSCLWT